MSRCQGVRMVFQVLHCLLTLGGVVIMLMEGSVHEYDRIGVG